MKVIVHVDGGARGNPGPAAAAGVISSPDGDVLGEHAELLGRATNNVAEYRALLLGLARARELGAERDRGDRRLRAVAKQIQGLYKVKHEAMRPLHLERDGGAARLSSSWSIRTVPRAQNARRRRARQRGPGPGARRRRR